MHSTEMKGHSETLASLLVKPVMCVSHEWKKLQADINDLCKCLINYSNYLDAQASKVNENHKKCEPVRSVGDSCVVYEACKVENQNLKDAYVLLDKSVRASAGQPVFFDENLHVKTGFRSNVERFKFYENVYLTMPVLILKSGAYPGFLDGGYKVLNSPSQPNAARGSGGALKAPPAGSGAEPQPPTIFATVGL